MTDLLQLLAAPQNGKPDANWFAAIADRLLNRTTLRVAGQALRLCEIEFYYNGPGHEDLFTHNDPIQKTSGRWYFHRDSEGYRGGSFKGLDISFGPGDAFGGILIRSLLAEDGRFINGCSLCVDRHLALTGAGSVAELDAAINERPVTDAGSPLYLEESEALDQESITTTARVGLTLKRASRLKTMPEYLMRRYRFMIRPREVKKGRLHHIIALHQDGHDVDQIRAATGSPKSSITKNITAHEEGRQEDSFRAYFGKSLKTADLCRLHGLWLSQYGAEG